MLWIEDPARPGSADELAAALHPDDAAELRAAGLALDRALAGVPLAALRRADGVLVCLFGCAPHPQAGGIPWMLCTTALATVGRREMALLSAGVVAGWRDRFQSLTNLVHRRHARAVRFVQWLGFTVDPTPCGPGQEFFAFHWSRACVTP